MALAFPGSMGRTDRKMGIGKRAQDMRLAIPSTTPEVGLS